MFEKFRDNIFSKKKIPDNKNNNNQKIEWETPQNTVASQSTQSSLLTTKNQNEETRKNYAVIQNIIAYDLANRSEGSDGAGNSFDLSSADIQAFYDNKKPAGYTSADALEDIVDTRKKMRRKDFLDTNLNDKKDVAGIIDILFNFDKKFNTNIIGKNTTDIDTFLAYYGFTTDTDKEKAKKIIQQSVKQYKISDIDHKEIKSLLNNLGINILQDITKQKIESIGMRKYLAEKTGLAQDDPLHTQVQSFLVNEFTKSQKKEISPNQLIRKLQDSVTHDVTEKSLRALLKVAETGIATPSPTTPTPPAPSPTTPTPPAPSPTTPTPPPPPPAPSTPVTRGFKTAEELYTYLISDSDSDTVDLKTAQNLYKTMLNNNTTLSNEEKAFVKKHFEASGGTNQKIDNATELNKLLEALNGTYDVIFNPNAQTANRLIDKDGVKKTPTPTPPSSSIKIEDVKTEIDKLSKAIFNSSDIASLIIDTLFPNATQTERTAIKKNIAILFNGTQSEKDLFGQPLGQATKITKKALVQVFEILASDNGKNYELNLKEVLNKDNWNEMVRANHVNDSNYWNNKPYKGEIQFVGRYLGEYFNNEIDTININKDGDISVYSTDFQNPLFKTSDKTKYATLTISDNDKRTITVDKKMLSLVQSLMNNSSLFKKSIIDTLDKTGYDSLYILDADSNNKLFGSAVGATDDAAVLIIDSALHELRYGRKDTNEGEQGLASTIIHELGHLDGSLGADCDYHVHFGTDTVPNPFPNENFHGPIHSRFIMERMAEWLQKTGKEPVWNLEVIDYSFDTYEDRTVKIQYSDTDYGVNSGNNFDKNGKFNANPDKFLKNNVVQNGVFDINVTGKNQNIGQTFYAIQDALINGNITEVTKLLKSLDGTTFDREYYTPHTGAPKQTIKDFSAHDYVIELLLYETIDNSVLGGFDTIFRLQTDYNTLLTAINNPNFFFFTDKNDIDRDGNTTEPKQLDDDLKWKEEIREIGDYGNTVNAKSYNTDSILASNLKKYLDTNPSTKDAFTKAAFFVNFSIVAQQSQPSTRSASAKSTTTTSDNAGLSLLHSLMTSNNKK